MPLGVLTEVESPPMTTCVIVMLPVMVLVPEVLLSRSRVASMTFLRAVETVVIVVQDEGVDIVTVQDEVMGYPAAAFSMCHVEQLVIEIAGAVLQD